MSGIATEDDDMTKDAAAMSAPSAGSLPLDQIICGDNCEVMRQMPSESIDLVVTSPPYDDIRDYGGHAWDFYGVAWNLKRILKPGGVIVWNVADATRNGTETCSSMRQAMHFRDIGFNLHDTMIYHRHSMPSVALLQKRYEQHWEYCFVFSRGAPNTCNHLREPKKYIDTRSAFKGQRKADGRHDVRANRKACVRTDKIRGNVWKYNTGGGHIGDRICHEHPAPFPESLARDHILSWSNPGDVVLDPFSGSGTTAKMAREAGRRFIGIEVNPEYVEISRKRLTQQALPMDVA
jgi:site-specific DNA-methyltransferase (adenine-specific)